ncbi:MAG: DUF4174 domain-containing protein [Myxococcota bacterium]
MHAPVDLSAHRWQHRLLLLFAEGPAADGVPPFLVDVQREAAGIMERDLILAMVYASEEGAFGSTPLSMAQNAALRAHFDVAVGETALLLVGKDGGVKVRATPPVDLADIFQRIDAMPMRQQEMRRNRP